MLIKAIIPLVFSLIMLPVASSAGDFDYAIYSEKVMEKNIPKKPRTFDGIFDRKKYGDWLLVPVDEGYSKITSTNYIPTNLRFQIMTPDILGGGHVLAFFCFGYIADEGSGYYSITSTSGVIKSGKNIRNYSKYSYIFDDSRIAEEPTKKVGDDMIPIGLNPDRMNFFLKNFRSKSEFKGMLSWSEDGGGIAFVFSLSGFSSAYSELSKRCRDSTYITYNGIIRDK